MKPRFCVIGARHRGLVMSGHLGLLGFDVQLYDPSPERVEPVRVRGGVQLEGVLKGFGSVSLATTDPAEAVRNCDIVMVVVPATAHRDVAETLGPHLRDGQIVVLSPGRTFGAIEFRHAMKSAGWDADTIIAEAQALLYASRAVGPGQAKVLSLRNSVPVASLRAHLIPRVLEALRCALPQFVPGDSVLNTGLNSIGPALHPAQMVLNAAWVEDGSDFEFYGEGLSPSVCRVLESIDRERVAVAETLGIRGITALQWLYMAHNVSGKSLYEVVRANPSYRGIMAPRRLSHRYLTEDIATCLVPISSIGREFGQPTPAIDSIVNLASATMGTDFRAIGRTVESLGLKGMSLRDLRLLAIGSERADESARPRVEAIPAPSAAGTAQ